MFFTLTIQSVPISRELLRVGGPQSNSDAPRKRRWTVAVP
jgi:hypothetical protein